MNNEMLNNLQYILPTKFKLTDDPYILATAKNFKSLYGGGILNLLWRIGALQQSESYVKKTVLNHIINRISTLIALQQKGCFVWKQNGVLKIMPYTTTLTKIVCEEQTF